MTIFSLVFAFLLEQWHPVGSRNRIIFASGTGALGVRLGDSTHEAGGVYYRPELGLGEKADMDFLQSTIGLIWCTIMLWSVLLFLMGIAN